MSEQKPTNDNGDTPRPSASPHGDLSDALAKSALFSTDPVYKFHRERDAVPRVEEESLQSMQEEITEPVQEELITEPAQEPVQEELMAEPAQEEAQIVVEEIQEESEEDLEIQVDLDLKVSDPEPYSDFVQWLLDKPAVSITFESPAVDAPEEIDAVKEKKPKKSKSKKKRKKATAAKKKKSKRKQDKFSVGDDILSETLADLLATQGYIKKAIQMYERLSLIYPEKSRLFAAKIEELKKIE